MTAEKDHIPALDGLRGLAALAVIGSHIEKRWGESLLFSDLLGTFGVLLFFTLSGFLMSYLYASRNFTITSVYNYAVNRGSRILPVYLLVVILSYLIYNYMDHQFVYPLNNGNIIRHLLLSGNVWIFWSIPPEIQFYFFFAFLWWAIDRFTHGKYWPTAIVIAASFVMIYFSTQAPGTTLPSKFHIFMFGVIAGQVRYHWTNLRLPKALNGGITCILLPLFILTICFAQRDGYQYRFPADAIYLSPLCSLVCAATILFLSYSSTFSNAVFGCSLMRLLGAWSFTLYLINEPYLQIAERLSKAGILNLSLAVVLVIGAAIGTAAILHIYFEKPVQAAMKKNARSLFALIVRHLPESSGVST